jgi:hypothetical protein
MQAFWDGFLQALQLILGPTETAAPRAAAESPRTPGCARRASHRASSGAAALA